MSIEEETSIHKAIRILREFTRDEPELGVTELSRRVGIAKSTVGRLVQILEDVNLIQQNAATRKYHLSLNTLEIGAIAYHKMEVSQVAPPFLRKLLEAVRSEIQLLVYDQGSIVCLIKLPEDRDTRILTSMGMRVPCYCTAAGKVLLAFQPDGEISRVLQDELKRFTKNTITSPEAMRSEIIKIRDQGYAISDEEYREGLYAVSVPIFDDSHKVVAAIGVTRLKQMFPSSEIQFVLKDMKLYSRLISEQLGLTKLKRRKKT
jgi:IclR family KDG regulon transcriptional repressor